MASIQGVYVALFGRPADPAGLAYFNGVTNNGANLSAISNLAGQPEFKARFDGKSNVAIVNSIYQSLFNRDAEPAGLNFFVDALNKGTLNVNNIAIAILDGAQDGATNKDKTIVTNKVAAADLFTKSLDTASELGSYTGTNANAAAAAWLQTVGATAQTQAQVDAQIKAIEVIGTGGVTVTTSGIAAEAVSTAAADAKFKTTGGDDTVIATATPATLKVDAGFGTDTLKATTSAGWTPAAGDIKSVEKLFVTATGAHNVALTNVTGLKEVWNENSGAFVSAISAINSGAAVGVKDTVGTASFSFAEAQTGTTSVVLNKAAVATSLTVTNGSDTVALSTSGGSSVTGYTDASVKTLNITGSGTLTLVTTATAGVDADLNADTVDSAANLTKVDASGLSGALTINLNGAAKGVTITGTANADKITLDQVDAQKDVIVYTTAEKSTYSLRETITNFDTAQDKVDLKAFAFAADKQGVAAFAVLPVEGASYGSGNSVGIEGNLLFIDSNKDGIVNLATDVVVEIAGIAAGDIVWA